ncbi:biotin holocarboxylase synthetase [Chytriomyces hyalinus]|nr:biotin holocarboxylase synthetase [Chytriomyces hyalinus]
MNILVYNGPGTARTSTERTLTVLKSLLKGRCDVLAIGPEVINHADRAWQSTTALLVVPGGRDLPYVESLAGFGVKAIQDFVRGGGSYLGICAGAYFATKRVEFETGTPLEVVGDRKLALVSAVARGSAAPGFVYDSEDGARSISIIVDAARIGLMHPDAATPPYRMNVYCNGAPYFDIVSGSQVEVLATYDSNLVTENAKGKPAIVQSSFGKGKVILMGPHLEHDNTANLPDLSEWDKHQKVLLVTLLQRLGLSPEIPIEAFRHEKNVSEPLILSNIADSASGTNWLSNLLHEHGQVESENVVMLKDSVTNFKFVECNSSASEYAAIPSEDDAFLPVLYSSTGQILQTSAAPSKFNIQSYFNHLKMDRSGLSITAPLQFGSQILSSESISSTQTILEKNYRFSTALPNGIVCVASKQFSGRGRGANSWVSQEGCLMFSLAMQHKEGRSAIFLQYLFGLAVVEAIRSMEGGYSALAVHLKWPNDIYCYSRDPETRTRVLKKIGGILVNSSYMNGVFSIVIGCGLNVANNLPTTSLNELIAQHNSETNDNNTKLAPLTRERVLARILSTFESMYQVFAAQPLYAFAPFIAKYHDAWLHTDQYVYLQDQKVSARIVGLDESGMLKAEGVEDREVYLLQPDGNSFDMMKGLISRKK